MAYVQKNSPIKQMETIKKIGSKIAAGGKWLADAAEGKKGTSNYSGSDETMRQKNIVRNNPKTEEVKKVVKKAVKKTSPVKQMETIKKIGSKIAEGGKWLADAAEGKKGTANYSGGDETARQKNTGSAKNKKAPVVKKPVAKMKKC